MRTYSYHNYLLEHKYTHNSKKTTKYNHYFDLLLCTYSISMHIDTLFSHFLMIHLPLFVIPIVVAIIIQSIKIIVDFFAEGRKKLKIDYLWRAGWFPSVHSGISSSLTTLMWLTYGIQSAQFAVALCFSILFWYDAMNVRYEAGKHAQYINEIKEELKSFSFIDYKLNDLKERLGHTLVEVIGGIFVGSAITWIIYYITPIINSLLAS